MSVVILANKRACCSDCWCSACVHVRDPHPCWGTLCVSEILMHVGEPYACQRSSCMLGNLMRVRDPHACWGTLCISETLVEETYQYYVLYVVIDHSFFFFLLPGQVQEAAELLMEALSIFNSVFGPVHELIGSCNRWVCLISLCGCVSSISVWVYLISLCVGVSHQFLGGCVSSISVWVCLISLCVWVCLTV